MADRRVACLGPVPGSTAASAVLIGALADETPLNSGTPGEAVAAATATREGACGPRDRQIHQLGRSSYSQTTPANARVQGLPSNSKCFQAATVIDRRYKFSLRCSGAL